MSVNLYDVLNIKPDATKKDIRDSFRRLAKIYHPDKRETGNADLFELINNAYDILSNPVMRAEYDNLYKLSKNNDHSTLKSKSKAFYEASETSITTKTKEEAQKEFEEHNKKIIEGKLTNDDFKSMYDDISLAREQDDIEFTHERLFKTDKLSKEDNIKFNEAFDKIYKADPYTVSIYSNLGAYEAGMQYEELKPIDTTNSINSNPNERLSRKHIKEINPENSKYDLSNTKLSEAAILDKIREREDLTTNFANLRYDEFKLDGDNFGVFSNLGMNVNGMNWNENINTDDVQARYQALLNHRKNF
jgi:curved DNA-binding protein CbpA